MGHLVSCHLGVFLTKFLCFNADPVQGFKALLV